MFRFTIRDVLWLMVVVAILTSSLMERRALIAAKATLETEKLEAQRDLANLEQSVKRNAMRQQREARAVNAAIEREGYKLQMTDREGLQLQIIKLPFEPATENQAALPTP
jgi:hypothetical protein